jgi:hypothetical protein
VIFPLKLAIECAAFCYAKPHRKLILEKTVFAVLALYHLKQCSEKSWLLSLALCVKFSFSGGCNCCDYPASLSPPVVSDRRLPPE